MATKRTTKKPYLPDAKDVVNVIDVPAKKPFRILRTNIVDPYEKRKTTRRPRKR